jgi:hypothetical protein
MQLIADGRNKNGKRGDVSAEIDRKGVWGRKEVVELGEGIRVETVSILIPYTCTDHSLSWLDTCSFKNVADLS